MLGLGYNRRKEVLGSVLSIQLTLVENYGSKKTNVGANVKATLIRFSWSRMLLRAIEEGVHEFVRF